MGQIQSGKWRSSLLRDCSWGEFHKAPSFPRGAVFLQRSVSRNQNPWGQRGVLGKCLTSHSRILEATEIVGQPLGVGLPGAQNTRRWVM